jgi:hypothetical protein
LPKYIKGISTGGFCMCPNMPTSAAQRLRTENVELYGVIQRFRDFLTQCSLLVGLSNVCMVNTAMCNITEFRILFPKVKL